MKKRKLNYRFHNPNSAVVTADYITKIFIEANAGKVETAVQKAADTIPASDESPDYREGRSA